jgi:hypothetical protein
MDMDDLLLHRDVLKPSVLSEASMAPLSRVLLDSPPSGSGTTALHGDYFTLMVDEKKGTFSILRSDGSLLLQHGISRVNTDAGKLSVASVDYKSGISTSRFTDPLGAGQRATILFEDMKHHLDMTVQIALYDRLEAVTMAVIAKNVSTHECSIFSLEPVCAVQEYGGCLVLPGVTKCLTNGALYYDAGKVHPFGTPFVKPEPYGETKGGKLMNDRISTTGETVHTWWNAGFFSGYDKEGLVLGYLENDAGLGQFLISGTRADHLSFIAESVYNPGLVLKPGQSIHSNRVVLLVGRNPYAALESYAAMVGTIGKARTHSIINGWCSWFYTYEHVTEAEVIRNAEFAAKHLKKYGLEYIQIDEGYQRWHGDWEGNERFPHGMKWLADRIKGYGLKAGIWVAPYVVSEPAGIFQKNPDWFLKNPDGGMKRVGPWPGEDTEWARTETPRRFGLDITHPGAAQWLHNLMGTITNRWGYEMIKIDFVAWSILSAHHFYDAAITPAQAYRKGYEIMRGAVGEKCHLLECGPGAVSVGLIDSMRIEYDQNYGYSREAWKQYFLQSSSSAPAAAKRYYFHKRTWINDADHICLNMLSASQAQAAATLVALSGGNILSGDRLTELDAVKLDILGKVFPAYGEAARPVDLFDTDLPSTFALTVRKSFGEWTLAGFFNPDIAAPVVRTYPLDRLWLSPDKPYLVYDFWKENFMGEISGKIHVVVPPGAVSLLAFHEKTGVPQFISTNRHVLQGAIEVEQSAWDPETKTLTGISTGPLHSSHYVTVYLPEPSPWKQSGRGLFNDYGTYSLNRVDTHIMRVWLHFNESERIAWKIEV